MAAIKWHFIQSLMSCLHRVVNSAHFDTCHKIMRSSKHLRLFDIPLFQMPYELPVDVAWTGEPFGASRASSISRDT